MKDNGGPAYPSKSVYGRCEACGWDENPATFGMSLRDYIATKVIQGLLTENPDGGSYKYYAAVSYKFADAMLKEREK